MLTTSIYKIIPFGGTSTTYMLPSAAFKRIMVGISSRYILIASF